MRPDTKAPKPGESFHCNACGRESIAKAQRVMDGWRCTGETIVCAFCQAPVSGATASDSAAPAAATSAPDGAALDRLAKLLGTQPTLRPEFADQTKGHFCKDCRHYLRHPFYSRCLRHERPVEPMDDCADFAPRPPDDAPAGQAEAGGEAAPGGGPATGK